MRLYLLFQALKVTRAQNYPGLYQPAAANQQFTNMYDISNVPKAQLVTPHAANDGPTSCVNRDFCSWGCNNCVAPGDIVTCPKKGDWALSFDDGKF